MKKFTVMLFALLAVVLAFGVAACANDEGADGEYTVNYRIGSTVVHTEKTTGKLEGFTPEEKTGHTFDGWYLADTCTGDKFTAEKTDKNLELYGKYVPVSYTVTMDIDGETTTVKADHGTAAVLPKPEEKTGYTFDGWYIGEECTGDKYVTGTPVTGDFTVYGTYILNTYTVTMDIDGEKKMIKVDHGAVADIPTPDQKTGYTFDGWYLNAECNGAKYDMQSAVKGNINIYGKYVPNVYTVTLHVDDRQTEIKAAYGTVANISSGERTGYKFNGWYIKSDLTGDKYALNSTVKGDIDLYGEYTLIYEATYTSSSSAAENAADKAGDGFAHTAWKAAAVGENTLTVDLSEVQEVRRVTQKFAESAVWDFVIEGSRDNTNWATFTDCTKDTADDTYGVTVNGYFRYIRLVVKNTDKVASSSEFVVTTADMSKGTNIALGMKGASDSWAGGCETENAFDGNYSNMYCANDGGMGHYLAVEWTYDCYVEYVEFHMPTPIGVYNYEVEGRIGPSENNNWIKLEEACDHEGNVYGETQTFTLEVKREVSAVLIRFIQTPGWNAVREINVYGFKNVANGMTPEETADGKVYAIGDSYIGAVAVDGETPKAEYSIDGNTWTELTIENGFARADVYGGYIRTSGNAKIFATPLDNDLAMYIVPTTANEGDTSGDATCAERVCTMNPENTWRQFWCASAWNEERVLTFDLGNVCNLASFAYTFQDEIATPSYKLKVELSLDGENYTTKFDNFETGAAGKTFTGDLGNTRARYVKVTVHYVEGWTNCRQFSLYGTGAPVRYVEIR